MIKVKRFVTLIELMIAMGLAMGLLSFALYFYRYAVFMDAELKKDEVAAFRERILTGHLSHVFSRLIVPPFFTLSEQNGITLGPSVVFSYNSDTINPLFHGPVLGRLFVDPKKRVMLVIWQHNKLLQKDVTPLMHQEVLAENVEGIKFEFLVGPTETDTKFPDLRPGQFLEEWKAEYNLMPRALRMTFLGDDEIQFAFPLAVCKEQK